ncbi:MAG: NFACT family protein [Clostridiales bacterium]|jgi:predicted ribosome quality control (RQC) complex YloA/Tae2 family protein|nr:NFACT family protein [Clostridiales bacterium]
MAFDGVAIACLLREMSVLVGGRIDKITQPEGDEIVMTVRAAGANHRLLLSCNANYPRLHFTAQTKESPLVAPMFCMVLRKHIQGGRIRGIFQPGLERIVRLEIEARDEMGDLGEKTLILEVMGRHSNIILTQSGVILDSIKHISAGISSRQVLPGRAYADPPTQDKLNPLELEFASFQAVLERDSGLAARKAIFHNYTGISAPTAGIICQLAGLDPDLPVKGRDIALFEAFEKTMERLKSGRFEPYLIYGEGKNPQSFAFYGRGLYDGDFVRDFDSPSSLVEYFYSARDSVDRIRQKSADMRKLVQNLIARQVKKADMQEKTRREVAGRDRLRLFGELITANIYAISGGENSFTAQNFYEEDLPLVEIALDPQKSPAENAQAYFKKYNKQKRTAEALKLQMAQTSEELAYLEGVLQSIEQSENVADLAQIRGELQEGGFVKKRSEKRGQRSEISRPLRFEADGFEIFVGKNNRQNDELLRGAGRDDIWLHAKNIPGSHVIVRAKNGEISEAALEAAANFAAFYSKGRGSSLVPVDYCARKNVKKPPKAKPGMVIYDNYKTVLISPESP